MDYISGWCTSKRRLDGCTAIVTGCNTGIGKETALDFYTRGARVIMACRNLEKAETAKVEIEKRTDTLKDRGTLLIEQLDLCSFKSVKEFAARILASEKSVDILVNNAGVMMCPQGNTEDGFETHIGSNHFGHALLTFLLIPVMAKSAPSRIVNVSSYLHERFDLQLDDINFERSHDPYAAYCRSKAANVLFTKALARKLKEHNIPGVKTYSVHPGVIRTDISRHFDKTVWFGASWAFNNILGWFLKSPICGAQTTIYCAVDEKCSEETGLYYRTENSETGLIFESLIGCHCKDSRRAVDEIGTRAEKQHAQQWVHTGCRDCAPKLPSKQCQDEEMADKFWALTVELLNYDPFTEDKLIKLLRK